MAKIEVEPVNGEEFVAGKGSMLYMSREDVGRISKLVDLLQGAIKTYDNEQLVLLLEKVADSLAIINMLMKEAGTDSALKTEQISVLKSRAEALTAAVAELSKGISDLRAFMENIVSVSDSRELELLRDLGALNDNLVRTISEFRQGSAEFKDFVTNVASETGSRDADLMHNLAAINENLLRAVSDIKAHVKDVVSESGIKGTELERDLGALNENLMKAVSEFKSSSEEMRGFTKDVSSKSEQKEAELIRHVGAVNENLMQLAFDIRQGSAEIKEFVKNVNAESGLKEIQLVRDVEAANENVMRAISEFRQFNEPMTSQLKGFKKEIRKMGTQISCLYDAIAFVKAFGKVQLLMARAGKKPLPLWTTRKLDKTTRHIGKILPDLVDVSIISLVTGRKMTESGIIRMIPFSRDFVKERLAMLVKARRVKRERKGRIIYYYR